MWGFLQQMSYWDWLALGVILLILTGMIGIATVNQRARNPARANLTALVAAYGVLPVMMAVLPAKPGKPEKSMSSP